MESKKIIIDITEKEETILSGKGELESITMNGTITVKNPSSSHRIWNSNLLLEGINSISIQDSVLKIGEISAGNSKEFTYEISTTEVVQKPMIELSEIIDTYFEKEGENHWNFVLNHRMPTSFTLKLSNKSKAEAICHLTKWVPDYFDTPHIDAPGSGNTEYKEDVRELHWNEVKVLPDEEVTLSFRVGATPYGIDLHETGKIEVNYEIPTLIRSTVTGRIDGLSDNLFAVDNEEVSENNWDCTLEFQNISDIQMILNKATISHVKENTKEIVLDESPDIELASNDSWKKNFTVESVGIPKFSKTNKFSVISDIEQKIIGNIIKNTGTIPVAAIGCEKILEPEFVNAHAKTNVKVKSITKNTGTASLFQIKIEDTIPSSFKPPSLDLIKTKVEGTELRQGVILEIEPNDEEPTIEHILTVSIPNLADIHKPLDSGEEITIEYPITAWDPSPGDYPCPLKSDFNVIPEGPSVIASVPEVKLVAKTVRRKYRAHKSVTPGSEEGEYIIPIVFSNQGEVLVERVTIKDIIPSSFIFVSSEPADISPTVKDIESGTEIVWELTNIAPGEEAQLKYIIKGTGEYESQDPEISFD